MGLRLLETRYEKQKRERGKRKKLNFTEIDHVLRHEKKLSLKEYAIIDEIYRKQNLPGISGKCKGWCWEAREQIAESKGVSVDLVDKIILRKHCLEMDSHGCLRLKSDYNWKPDIENAKEVGNFSVIYHDLQENMPQQKRISDEEFCVLSLVSNYSNKSGDKGCTLSNQQIADRLKMSKRSVVTYLYDLQKKGWISISREGNARSIFPEEQQQHENHFEWREFVDSYQKRFGKETAVETRTRLNIIDLLQANNILIPEKMKKPKGYQGNTLYI